MRFSFLTMTTEFLARLSGLPLPLILSNVVLLSCLSGCGVLYTYVNNEDKLDERLSVPMTKEQVLEALGKPDEVLRDDGRQIEWLYVLYPRHQWFWELIGCPVWALAGGCLFYSYTGHFKEQSHHVVLLGDQLCLWGPPQVVHRRRSCTMPSAPSRAEEPAKQPPHEFKITVTPVIMPPPIREPVSRLVVIPSAKPVSGNVAVVLDTVLSILRTRHPHLVLVERDLQPVLDELHLQYSGRVDDETAVRVGRLTGGGTILVYRIDPLRAVTIETTSESTMLDIPFEARLIQVETGQVLFRQTALVTVSILLHESSASKYEAKWTDEERGFIYSVGVTKAAIAVLSALLAAFGDNPLGIVPYIETEGEGVEISGVLTGGPAHRAGIRENDRILEINGQPVHAWTDPVSLPALLTIVRGGERQEVTVTKLAR